MHGLQGGDSVSGKRESWHRQRSMFNLSNYAVVQCHILSTLIAMLCYVRKYEDTLFTKNKS